MNVFNSLGSNYTIRIWWTSLLHLDVSHAPESLRTYLAHRYNGRVRLFYKGREAMAAALRLAQLPEGSPVFFTGFTCYAVYQAVTAAGLKPVFLDIEPGDVNFSVAALTKACKRHAGPKAVILQNTFGIPCDSKRILNIARKYGLIIIEDLAHAVGATYADGREVGSIGHFTVLSLSQDKIIDGISGGALVVRTTAVTDSDLTKLHTRAPTGIWKDRLYPPLTLFIRSTYPLILGKIVHLVSKNLRLLMTPMGNTEKLVFRSLPAWHARWALDAFERFRDDLRHRQQIAAVFTETLNPEFRIPAAASAIATGSFIRYPITVRHRLRLIDRLKASGIYISDIWYDAPVAPHRFLLRTNYAGECPQAEALADTILNLPTHRNISTQQAKQIALIINTWHP